MNSQKKDQLYAFVGGGSGGHLTPLIPVGEALKKLDSNCKIVHIGQKGDRLNTIITSSAVFSSQKTVHAGKFRRYHGESWIRRILDIKTFLFNVRDAFYFAIGIVESWFLLRKLRPKAILMKGGYVCAPVGIAAGLRGIPYVTHDSDAMVSLAHKIIAKKAVMHTTAMDPSYYTPQYDSSKTTQVGVPVRSEYRRVTERERLVARKELGIPNYAKVLLAVGGGLGARNINNSILTGIRTLLADDSVYVIIITGHKLFDSVNERLEPLPQAMKERIITESFSDKLHVYSAAANVVVTRAGATNMAEFAAQGCACIIVPNPLLAGGHQLKNAKAYEQKKAAVVVDEVKAAALLVPVTDKLLHDEPAQKKLSDALYAMSSTDASEAIAQILSDVQKNTKTA